MLIAEAFLLLAPFAVGGVTMLRKDVNDGFVICHNLCMLADQPKPLPVLPPQVWCEPVKPNTGMLGIPAKHVTFKWQMLIFRAV